MNVSSRTGLSTFLLFAAILLYLIQELILLDIRWVDDESWYLVPAHSLVYSGKLNIPFFNDTYSNLWPGPPLLLYLEAISWWLHDMSVVQARTLTVLFGCGTIIATFFMCKRLLGESVAVISAFILAMDNLVFLAGRTVRPEILVCFFSIISIYFFVRAIQDSNTKFVLLAGLAAGLGTSSHPNGISAFLCILLFFWLNSGNNGAKLLFDKRLYWLSGSFFIGLLPWLAFLLIEDSKSNFAGIQSLFKLHSSGGSSFIGRMINSAHGELFERYNSFFHYPYRVHIGILFFAAIGFSIFQPNKSVRFLSYCILIYLFTFLVLVKSNKSVRYMTVSIPFAACLWGYYVAWFWKKYEQKSTVIANTNKNQLINLIRSKGFAIILFSLVGVSQLFGNLIYLWKFKDANYLYVTRQIDALIPDNSVIYSGMAFWLELNKKHTYIPYTRMPWDVALKQYQPTILLMDDWVMVGGSYPGEWDKLREQLYTYVENNRAKQLGVVENNFYGNIKVFQLTNYN